LRGGGHPGQVGRDMLDALVAGETDPNVLAELARKQMRKKIPALREALAGHFDSHHRLCIAAILRHIDFLDEQIEQLTGMIEEQILPFGPAVELLCTIPGIQRRGAECVIGEIGADMTRFVTSRHLASWAGQCPGNDQSAGKRRTGKTGDGSKWLNFALEEAAMAAIRVKGHYLEARTGDSSRAVSASPRKQASDCRMAIPSPKRPSRRMGSGIAVALALDATTRPRSRPAPSASAPNRTRRPRWSPHTVMTTLPRARPSLMYRMASATSLRG
jgi:transposase